MAETKNEAKKEGIPAFLTPQELHKLNRLVLQSRYVVEGNLAGAHRSPHKGTSSEFAEHKAYGFGDDPKHIDWRVLARTDKYYVKQFEDATNLRVYVALDRSHSMDYGSEKQTKFRYACRLVAALGYVTVTARDSFGLFLHSDKIDAVVEARNSYNHLHNMMKRIQQFEPDSTTSIAESLHQIASSVRHRALVVVISDLLSDEVAICKALAHFRKKLHDVIVLHVLDPMEIDLGFKKNVLIEDLETKEKLSIDPRRIRSAYSDVFGQFLEYYRKTCAGMKVDYRIARTDKPLDEFVRGYLSERLKL